MTVATRGKKKTVYRGNLFGSGNTVKEAKKDLDESIDRALEGSYSPVLITLGEYTILLWRTLWGYDYKLLDSTERLREGINPISASCCLNDTREEAIQSAAEHVIGLSGVDYHRNDEIPAFLTDRRKRDNILYCCRFRRAYKWAQLNQPDGIDNENDWRTWAFKNMSQFD